MNIKMSISSVFPAECRLFFSSVSFPFRFQLLLVQSAARLFPPIHQNTSLRGSKSSCFNELRFSDYSMDYPVHHDIRLHLRRNLRYGCYGCKGGLGCPRTVRDFDTALLNITLLTTLDPTSQSSSPSSSSCSFSWAMKPSS